LTRRQKLNRTIASPRASKKLLALQEAIRSNVRDAKAHYYLGNLLYDKHTDAKKPFNIGSGPARSMLPLQFPWRNLGIAWHNVRGNAERASGLLRKKAFRADATDARFAI